jgi:hypothetical protein
MLEAKSSLLSSQRPMLDFTGKLSLSQFYPNKIITGQYHFTNELFCYLNVQTSSKYLLESRLTHIIEVLLKEDHYYIFLELIFSQFFQIKIRTWQDHGTKEFSCH